MYLDLDMREHQTEYDLCIVAMADWIAATCDNDLSCDALANEAIYFRQDNPLYAEFYI